MNPRKTFSKVESSFFRHGYPRGINTDRKAERARRRYNRDTLYPAEMNEEKKSKETSAGNKRGNDRKGRGGEGGGERKETMRRIYSKA